MQAAASLAGVTASPGRGARRFLKFGNGTVELLDESYNANPMSVRAMLAILARTEPAKGGRRLLALGDMRELGEGADAYHAGLADAVAASGAARSSCAGRTWRRCGASSSRRSAACIGRILWRSPARSRRRCGQEM